MKYLFQHPEPIGIDHDMLTGRAIVEVATAVERAGWDGLAFTEHPAPGYRWLAEGGGHQTLDPFVALGAAAAVTSRITLLTYLLPPAEVWGNLVDGSLTANQARFLAVGTLVFTLEFTLARHPF